MKLSLVLLALLWWASAGAEQLYLLFQEDCGARIEYRRQTAGQPAPAYFGYTLRLPSTDKLLFETDGRAIQRRNELPTQYIGCGSERLTVNLVEQVNAGSVQLFVLRAVADGYEVQPVVMAASLSELTGEVRYHSPLADFSFSSTSPVIGMNLSEAGTSARVVFEGREGADCRGSLLFTQTNDRSAYPRIDYRLHPELGVVYRTLAGNGTYSAAETIQAVTVNGQEVSTYLEEVCAQRDAAGSSYGQPSNFIPYYVETTEYAETVDPYRPVPSPQPPPVERVAAPQPEAEPAPAPASQNIRVPQSAARPEEFVTTQDVPSPPGRSHRVAAGETLYRISVRYGVDVSTLKGYNGLTDNTIYVGQELLLEPELPVATEQRPVSSVTYVNSQTVNPPVDDRATQANYHIVQPGETVASLALRFGYTTARFREFNDLSSEQVALVGQRLRTDHCSCPSASELPLAAPPREPMPLVVVPPTRDEAVYATAYEPPTAVQSLPPAYGGGGRTLHVVQEGESLYRISRQYGVTVDELRQLNTLGPSDVIVPFQKLYVN